MNILLIFQLFSTILGFQVFTNKNLNLIESLIRHYSIKNIYIASEERQHLETYVNNLKNFKTSLTLNIHTNDDKNYIQSMEFVECCEMLFVTANSSISLLNIFHWWKVIYNSRAKLTILFFSNGLFKFISPLILASSQIIIFSEGKFFKAIQVAKFFKVFTTAEEFIETDRYETPELYWPELNIKYHDFSIADFPLLMGSGNPSSGLMFYFKSAFEKYYENRRNKHTIQNQYLISIYVSSDISGFSKGYPLKISKTCFLLPVIDEIFEQNFSKKPFTPWVWILWFLALIYFTIALRVFVMSDLFLCIFESLSCVLGSFQIKIKNKFIYIQMFLFGFFIWNLYNSKLTSFLSTSNIGKTLKTVEDINQANITLWAAYYRNIRGNFTDYIRRIFPKMYEYEQNTFKGKFNYSIGRDKLYKHLYDFDLTHGYLINEDKWKFVSHSQMLLKRKLFSFSEICTEYGFLYPFIIFDSNEILKDVFISFTLSVIESGLDLAWEKLSYIDINFKFRKDYEGKHFHILGFEYFEVTKWILLIGIISSILVFCVEYKMSLLRISKK